MKIKLNSIFVDDQDKVLAFYTGILGFEPSKDIPVGAFRWLTVVSPDGPRDVELVLEPNANPAAQAYQEAHRDLRRHLRQPDPDLPAEDGHLSWPATSPTDRVRGRLAGAGAWGRSATEVSTWPAHSR